LRLGVRTLLLLGVVAAILPSAAGAHGDPSLRAVRPVTGPPLITHGFDTREAMAADDGADRPAGRVGFQPGSIERPPACAADHAQRVLYARPDWNPGRYADSIPRIRSAVRRMDAVLYFESLASGGPTADYRVRCDAAGSISVGRFVARRTGLAAITSAARRAGYDSAANDYLIFFDGVHDESCGISSTREDERPVINNASNLGGGYAVVYYGCWGNETPMHEVGHMMGAVQYDAPHSTGTGAHCYDEKDVMCYSPDGGDRHQSGPEFDCAGRQRFDCGFDDYFDSAPEPGEYLATHWNLGSPLNLFIDFGATGEATDP
jgi:hypothetical protein